MIIWGSRTRNKKVGSGIFFCPRCNTQKSYAQFDVERWFTLYFIPLFRTETAGEYIECNSCAGTWSTDVLQIDPDREAKETADRAQAAILRLVREVMAMIVTADGVVAPEEVAAMRTVYEEATGHPMSETEARAALRQVDGDTDVARAIKRAGLPLNLEGKRAIMSAAIAMARADGSIAAVEQQKLRELAAALELSPQEVMRLVQP